MPKCLHRVCTVLGDRSERGDRASGQLFFLCGRHRLPEDRAAELRRGIFFVARRLGLPGRPSIFLSGRHALLPSDTAHQGRGTVVLYGTCHAVTRAVEPAAAIGLCVLSVKFFFLNPF